MLDIAMNERDGPVLMRDVARRQQISLMFLQQVLNPLITSGLVRSVRGPGGGVTLAKPASEICLNEVLKLLVGSTAPVECVSDPDYCARSKCCATRDTWIELEKSMNSILSATSIQDLVDRQKIKNSVEEKTYQI
jgi:Rrf2 family protein